MAYTFVEEEKKARCRTTLNTGGESEYFDQVVAVSQEMINEAMKKIYANNKALQEFPKVSNKNGSWSLEGDLGPPRILIPIKDEEYGQIYWQFVFKDGILKINDDENHSEISVKDWVIAVRVPLDIESYKEDATDSPQTRARKRNLWENLRETFKFDHENYSPQRLYANFSSAMWTDFCIEKSTLKFGGKDIRGNTITEQMAKDYKNGLREALIVFAEKRQEEGLTTMGTKFVRSDKWKELQKSPARFPPISTTHQSFPYHLAHGQAGITDYPVPVLGFEDPGSRNCLVYCQNVERESLKEKGPRKFPRSMLSRHGIFTTIGNATPGSRIDGTFAISHQLFFEEFLLKHLQQFTFATQVHSGMPSYEDNSYATSVNFSYTVGGNTDPAKSDSSAEPWKFKRIQENDKDTYQSTVEVLCTPELHKNKNIAWWTRYFSSGSPRVKVSWESGGSEIFVAGDCQYVVDIRSAKSPDQDPSGNLMNTLQFSRDTFDIRWDFKIQVSIQDGELTLTPIVGPNYLDVTGKTVANGLVSANPSQTDDIRLKIKESIDQRIEHLKLKVFTDGFNHQNKFIYPGTGQFNFSNVMLNDRGDLLATIAYSDFSSDEIQIPGNRTIEDPPVCGSEEVPCTHEHGIPVHKPLLAWSVTTPMTASPEEPQKTVKKKPVKPSTSAGEKTEKEPPKQPEEPEIDRRVSVTLTGVNKSDKTVVLEGVEILILTSKWGSEIFRSSSFKIAPNGSLNDVQISVTCSPDNSVALSEPVVTVDDKLGILFIKGKSGALTIPPEASIIVTAKGNSGNAGNSCDIDVVEQQVKEQTEDERKVQIRLALQMV